LHHRVVFNVESATPDTTGTASRKIGVSQQTVGRWVKAGRIPFTRAADGTHLLDPEAVDRIAAERKKAAKERSASATV
jgi:excisionase family DNA binding protein